MFEPLLTSFPFVIRYFQLKRRGEALSVRNMKTAVVVSAVMAFALFLMIFYFHPKSYSGLVSFRTVSIVAQTSGPVTEVNVVNGQRRAMCCFASRMPRRRRRWPRRKRSSIRSRLRKPRRRTP